MVLLSMSVIRDCMGKNNNVTILLAAAAASQLSSDAVEIYKKESPAVALLEVYGLEGVVSRTGSGFSS